MMLFGVAGSLFAQERQEIMLNDDWQFSRDRQAWETVSVPHDWAISGPFDKKWDLQVVRIEQNGEKKATEKSGRSGSLPWIGEGHYKRSFTIPEGFKGHAELLFDGAMAEPTVFINGQKAGYWAYGYNTFRVDATPFIKAGENELTVDLLNLEESSRWYPGAGIYRPVTLILTPTKSFLDDWSVFVKPHDAKKVKEGERVMMRLDFEIENPTTDLRYEVSLFDQQGNKILKDSQQYLEFGNGDIHCFFPVSNAHLWTPESPYLYTLVITLYDGNKKIDRLSQHFGIRTITASKKDGFQLNGVTRKLKGVCLHHDLGPLGAAVNKAALIRQVKILKDMGCDAIRTSHNMPSQMQMDVCDSLGMMVMAESFDMWNYKKCKNGYARFFSRWADKDIENMVRANRNHPSIVMWSIGNEVPEQGMQGGREIAMHLQDLCHQLDPTRPVTQGMDRAESSLSTGFAQVMDIPGFNYRIQRYEDNIKQLWQGFLLGSETASTISSRGVYKFPVVPHAADSREGKSFHQDGQCSSYDVESCSWSNLPDDDWRWQDDKPWVIGEFVWTGFDYLGEPTPYDEYWPSRSSYFGICDLAGLPKDRFYLYRSKWNKDEHTIHLLPHWSWGKERQGEVTPVYCYTDYPEAELFLNGKSQGRIRKNPDERLDRYRLRWNEVKYEPGELKVIVYDENGQTAGEKTLKTASKPAKLQCSVWTQQSDHAPLPTGETGGKLFADGTDLAFITVSLVDKQGTLIPDASDQLTFEVSGAGTFRAVCNGDATSLESFTQPTMKLFNGQFVVVVQAANKPGTLTLKVTDKQRKLNQTVKIPVK